MNATRKVHVPGTDEIFERRLGDGAAFQIVKNFVDLQALPDQLRDVGWECEMRREGDHGI